MILANMIRFILLALLQSSIVFVLPNSANSQTRSALVVGNEKYASIGELKNSVNDANLIAQTLKRLGFNVLQVSNTTRRTMIHAVNRYVKMLRGSGEGAIGVFYYAGHGISHRGENLILPVDIATTGNADDLDADGVSLRWITDRLSNKAPTAAHYVIFDACRSLAGDRGARAFVSLDAKPGMVIAFSTGPGRTASDVGSRPGNGPYATALASEIAIPGQDDLRMFHQVRVRVFSETGNLQMPWINDGLRRRVHFAGKRDPGAILSDPVLVREARALLSELGHRATASGLGTALKKFQKEVHLPVHGKLTGTTLAALSKEFRMFVADEKQISKIAGPQRSTSRSPFAKDLDLLIERLKVGGARKTRAAARKAIAKRYETADPKSYISHLFRVMEQYKSGTSDDYRIHLGILVALSRIKGGWEPTEQQRRVLGGWCATPRFNERTYKKVLRLAIKNAGLAVCK